MLPPGSPTIAEALMVTVDCYMVITKPLVGLLILTAGGFADNSEPYVSSSLLIEAYCALIQSAQPCDAGHPHFVHKTAVARSSDLKIVRSSVIGHTCTTRTGVQDTIQVYIASARTIDPGRVMPYAGLNRSATIDCISVAPAAIINRLNEFIR